MQILRFLLPRNTAAAACNTAAAATNTAVQAAVAVLAALVVLLAPEVARADGFIVVPRHPPDQPHIHNVPLAVREHRVTVTVTDRIAVTDVDQVFVNPNPRALEGTYLFPLPPGAAIDKFSIDRRAHV